jgi:hypothetical protein
MRASSRAVHQIGPIATGGMSRIGIRGARRHRHGAGAPAATLSVRRAATGSARNRGRTMIPKTLLGYSVTYLRDKNSFRDHDSYQGGEFNAGVIVTHQSIAIHHHSQIDTARWTQFPRVLPRRRHEEYGIDSSCK